MMQVERAGYMTFRRRTVAILVLAAMAFSSLVTALFFLNDSNTISSTGPSTESKDYQLNEAKLQKTFDTIRTSYVRPISDQALLDGAVRGMVAALGDPHSEYMNPQESKQFLSTIIDSSFSGIGAGVVIKDGHVTIESIVSGSPAEKARLRVNDQIQKVNGKGVAGLTLDKVVANIRGPKGSKVVLEIVRGGTPFSVTVVRKDIPQETVSKTMLKNHIGYVDISQFSQSTGNDFFKALTTLEKQQMKGLVIDLRGNPGGLLSVVVNMCEKMLPKDKTSVMTQDKAGKKVVYRAKASHLKPYPITILIDGGSASAAEIMAAAFQQSGRYTVIGTKSYGKGSVQTTMEFTDGSNLKLTIAKWLTPNGTWIDQHGGTKGITPNLVVDPAAITKATLPNPALTLKQDNNSNEVKNMQLILNGLGLKPGRSDGYFDAQTTAAVKAFQQITGLPVNGMMDSQTAKALGMALQNLLKDPKNDKQLQTAIQFLAQISE
jgi:carboxyl-terminal processing protease